MAQRSCPTQEVEPGESNADGQATWKLGEELRLSGRHAEAERLLRRAVADTPDDYRLHYELGIALSELDRLEEAIGAFLMAVRLNPTFGDACYRIGRAFSLRGMNKPAIEWFERGRHINPVPTEFLYAYGNALALAGCMKRATDIFDEWMQAEPDNPIARHLSRAVLGFDEPTKVPADYVRVHFDDFAPRFDRNLARIHYSGPRLVVSMLQQVAASGAGQWEIVDLGCGTGLVGIELRPLARRLVGVDLSTKMLDQARNRNIYDELVETDVVEYLQDFSGRFDVITASDVLTYFGDVSEFFHAASSALRPDGVVVVAVEALEGERDFQLNPTGRFSQSLSYLRRTMEGAGLAVTIHQDAMRHEASRPVATLVAAGIKTR